MHLDEDRMEELERTARPAERVVAWMALALLMALVCGALGGCGGSPADGEDDTPSTIGTPSCVKGECK